jgi:Ion channel
VRRRFIEALGNAIHVTWPVLSAIIVIQLALGLLTGFVEGWSVGDAVYFTFITGFTIGYGDLVPRHTLARALAIGIGFSGLLITAVIAAIAVHAMRSALIGSRADGVRFDRGPSPASDSYLTKFGVIPAGRAAPSRPSSLACRSLR